MIQAKGQWDWQIKQAFVLTVTRLTEHVIMKCWPFLCSSLRCFEVLEPFPKCSVKMIFSRFILHFVNFRISWYRIIDTSLFILSLTSF